MSDEERVYFSDGTGTSWDKGKKCYDFTYILEGDVLHRTVIGTPQCSTGNGKFRMMINGDTLSQTYIDNGYVSQWKRQ